MKVTVVVSGLPKHVPIAELARNIDMIFDTNDVGTFRVRDIPTDTDGRLVGLDFEDGFDAMHVQLMLDGFEYRLDNSREYTLKCKISNDPRHLRYHDEDYTDMDLEPNYERNSKSLVAFNQNQIIEQNANLNAQLILLKKKTMILEAERKLLKAKRKLKKEYHKDESVPSDEEYDHDQCPKASKRRKSKSRERHTPRKDKKISSPSKNIPSVGKKKSIKHMSHSKSRRSPSTSSSSTSRSRSPVARKELFKPNRSQSRSRTSQPRSLGSQSRSSRSQSRSRGSRSHYYIDQPKIPSTSTSHYSEEYLELRRLQYILRNSPTPCRPRKSPLYYKSPPSYKDYPSRRSREYVTEIVNVKNYNEHIYFESNHAETTEITKENEALAREFALKVEVAEQMAINEINNLVNDEKKLLGETDTKIVNNEFKKFINNEFKKIKTKLNQDMPLKEIVHFYRRGRRVDEDKEYLLKLIRELIQMDTNIHTNVTKISDSEKNDVSYKRRRSIENEMWNEVEEVLQEIPMDILQDKENNTHENICSSESESTPDQIDTINININCKISRPAKSAIVSTLDANAVPKVEKSPENNDKNKVIEKNDCKQPEKSEIVENNDNIKIMEDNDRKQREKPELIFESNITDKNDNNVPETKTMEDTTSKCDMLNNNDSTKADKILSDTKNGEQMSNNSHNNESSVNKEGEDEHQNNNVAKTGELLLDPIAVALEMLERNVPQNPLFVLPIKRIMGQMKSLIKKLSKDYDDLHNVTQIVLRERIVDLLKSKTNFMKTAQIISLYRSNYPRDSDETFINEIIRKRNTGNL